MRLKTKLFLAFLLSVFASALPIQPANAAPPAKAFGELPVGYDAAISPDGKELAIIINVKGTYGVITQKVDGSSEKPFYITLGEEIKPNYVKWVNNERFVVSVSKSEKFRSTPFTVGYLYTANINTKKTRLVVKPKGMFRQFNNRVVDWLEDDPEHILMAYSDEEWDSYPDIRKVNVTTSRDKLIKRGQPGIEYWDTDDNGVPRIGTGQTDGGNKRRVIYNTTTDKWDSTDEFPGLDAETPIFGILNDGTELVIGDYRGKDTLGLYVYNLNQKQITRSLFHNDNYDASGVVLSKDGETVIGAKYTAESDRTELLGEYGTLLDTLRAKFNGYDVDFLDQTQDGRTVLVKMSSPYDPGGVFSYTSGDADPRLLTKMYSEISDNDTGDVVAVKYTARDGQKIPAFATLPPGVKSPKNLPFIVLPHGGPYARDSKRFDYLAQFFATRGYGVLQMNFRGSEGYGKSFADAGRNNWVVMQQDVEDATRYLYRKGYADQSRTCIAGWSYGGYAALMGVSTDPDLYKCAIAMAALTDINDAKNDLKKYRGGKHVAKEFFGEAMQDKEVRRANSPVHVAGNIKVPVFLAHGDLDENVQFDQFIRMKRALKKAGVKATYMKFEDEDHFLSRQHNREKFFIGIDKFLQDVNGTSEYMK
ncbi:alpha/beta hydrolase family protein [Hellea balneolensis]|uniref:alpha/beta hydrolase family protein n=1 Tax=Hellea balneolensis TaxID=287478 RepID=UPI00040FC28B|nr:prolyl oligopeptidase family serine peptidase [Hellea balneolensis]